MGKPKSTPAQRAAWRERKRKQRERDRAGLVAAQVALDDLDLASALYAEGVIPSPDEDDHDALRDGLREFLTQWAKRFCTGSDMCSHE